MIREKTILPDDSHCCSVGKLVQSFPDAVPSLTFNNACIVLENAAGTDCSVDKTWTNKHATVQSKYFVYFLNKGVTLSLSTPELFPSRHCFDTYLLEFTNFADGW